ncbi:MAG TPA: hypothetical protein VNZ23_17535 [Xanthobacteraceae bacterium]|nr:hypothetical protein [Xanthobacteraceae bacterium]
MDATPEKPEGAGYDEERRQTGFLPDFREAIKAARGPREGDRAPTDTNKDAILHKIVELASQR